MESHGRAGPEVAVIMLLDGKPRQSRAGSGGDHAARWEATAEQSRAEGLMGQKCVLEARPMAGWQLIVCCYICTSSRYPRK
eukprot:1151392-Pelagomonas_calceolata.AAC.10